MLFITIIFSTLLFRVEGQGECTDLRGHLVNNGSHYIPGPDTCKLCVCFNGLPKVCKEVLCSPPQDCRSFRVGNTCCEFICLDDVLKPIEPSAAVRVIGFSILVLLVLFTSYMICRAVLNRQRPPRGDDQRSLASIGYISGSMAYVGGTCETGMSAWKPSSNYLPRGEAPPPYDEAVAQSRAEAMRLTSEPAYHRAYPVNVDNMRPEDPLQYTAHSYGNLQRPVMQMPNMQNCYNAPLLQTVHQSDNMPPNIMHHHPLAPTVSFPSSVRLGGSLGAISPRAALSLMPRDDRPHHTAAFYTNAHHTPMHGSFHRTIPRISTAGTILDTSLSHFTRDRSLQNEIRRSFHKPNETRSYAETGRSMPRINLTSNTDLHRTNDGENITRCGVRPRILSEGSAEKTQQKNVPKLNNVPQVNNVSQINVPQVNNVSQMNVPQVNNASQINNGSQISVCQSNNSNAPAPQNTLPLTVDKPSCVCSYDDGPSDAAVEETDDYRSECENCKSASSSRWVLDPGWEEEESTQTLERRVCPSAPPPPAPSTLPTSSHRPSRNTMGPPSNWEHWFNAIPDSDSDSEEE